MKNLCQVAFLVLITYLCFSCMNKKEKEWLKYEAEQEEKNEHQYKEYLKYKNNVDSIKNTFMPLSFKAFELGGSFSKCFALSKNDTTLYNVSVKNELVKSDFIEDLFPALPQIVHYSASTCLFEPPLEFNLNVYSINDTIYSIKLLADYFKTDSCKYFKNGHKYNRTEYHKSKYFDKIFIALVQQYSKKYGKRIPSNYKDFHFEDGWNTFNESIYERDCGDYCWEFKNGMVSLKRQYHFSTQWYECYREQRSTLVSDIIEIEYLDSFQNKKIEDIYSMRKDYLEKKRAKEKLNAKQKEKNEKERFNASKAKLLDDI